MASRDRDVTLASEELLLEGGGYLGLLVALCMTTGWPALWPRVVRVNDSEAPAPTVFVAFVTIR